MRADEITERATHYDIRRKVIASHDAAGSYGGAQSVPEKFAAKRGILVGQEQELIEN